MCPAKVRPCYPRPSKSPTNDKDHDNLGNILKYSNNCANKIARNNSKYLPAKMTYLTLIKSLEILKIEQKYNIYDIKKPNLR